MSVNYQPILWNPFKKRYDRILWIFIGIFVILSFILNRYLFPQANVATLIIRSFGLLSLVLLHIILSIGPLCRINPAFLPLLYNRRHLGVSMFFIASIHAGLSIFWFHGNGNLNPILSVFTSNTHYDSFLFFPFQTLGFVAYLILMLMAFTSHDFWLAALTPKVWKALHMLVYLAYFLVILHVVLGVLQLENNPITYLFMLVGLVFLSSIHIWAGVKSYRFDTQQNMVLEGWHYVSELHEIEPNKAKMVNLNNERIAVFKYDQKLSAVHNVCKHQNGPLGEGKIVDGCITCPWHGYQYQPQDGCSPAPFTEKLSTYQLKLIGTKIHVNPAALPEGTFVEPLTFTETPRPESNPFFFIGWLGQVDKQSVNALKRFVFPAIGLGFLFLILFTINQQKIAHSAYAYNEVAVYAGVVSNSPFPHLLYTQGKDSYGNPKYAVLPLVNAWKFGADSLINKWCAQNKSCAAEIHGTRITRDGVDALELTEEANAFERIEATNLATPNLKQLGKQTLRGEIIDPKCYLGAMNPGEGKPHRSCAIRCISGGIMPMLTYQENNKKKYAVLLGENGEKINPHVLDFVAEPIAIEGKLVQYENWNCFYINPKNIKRLKN